MRLVKLRKEPIRVEGKYGVVIIKAEPEHISVSTIPDTGCHSRINLAHLESHELEGHIVFLEKR